MDRLSQQASLPSTASFSQIYQDISIQKRVSYPLRDLIQSDEFSVLKWQIIRSETSTRMHHLHVRLLRGQHGYRRLSDDDLVRKLKNFLNVDPDTEGYFQITFVAGLQEFERSKTGNKVMHYLELPKD